MHRVVVTGIGPVTPIGIGVDEFTQSLLDGTSGISPFTRWSHEIAGLPETINAGQVPEFNPKDRGIRLAKKYDRSSIFAMLGADLAIADANLTIGTDYDPMEMHIILGTGLAGAETYEKVSRSLQREGSNKARLGGIPLIMPNALAYNVGKHLGRNVEDIVGYGDAKTENGACASGGVAVIDAYERIRSGRARAAITGSVDACLTPVSISGFTKLGALTTAGKSRPFDVERDGFVPAEGGAVLVLENLDDAKRRGAHIYGEIISYGVCSGAGKSIMSPNTAAMNLAVEHALIASPYTASHIHLIDTHGTSTELNDKAESELFAEKIGVHVPTIAMKSATGHSLGGAESIELAGVFLAMQTGMLPQILNLRNPDVDNGCTLDYVVGEARKWDVGPAISTSFAFGDINTVFVVAPYE